MAKRCLIVLALLLHGAAQTSNLHVGKRGASIMTVSRASVHHVICSPSAHLLAAKSPTAIPDEYIVVFNRWTSDEEGRERSQHETSLTFCFSINRKDYCMLPRVMPRP